MKQILKHDGDVVYVPNFIPSSNSLELFKKINQEVSWQEKSIKMFGKNVLQPRKVAWHGKKDAFYKYSGVVNTPQPFTKTLLNIKTMIETKLSLEFNSCLLNLYRDGHDYMGYHKDNERELGQNPLIASLSLGATRSFLLKHKKDNLRHSIELETGSLLVMKGATQNNWHHALPKRLRVKEPRINLTFRKVLKR